MTGVSVIIPTYNRAGLVNQTVQNVLSQSLPPSEVIVVDDGSTDNTVDSLNSEFGTHIHVVQQQNQGPGAARNAGLRLATGDFIWLMDSDDLASLNQLETQVDSLKRHSADVVYSPWARVWFKGNRLELDGPVLQQRAIPDDRDCLEWFSTGWSLVFQHCLFRKSLIDRVGFYRTDLWTCDDSEYFWRVLYESPKIIFDDRSIMLYRLDDYGKVTASGFGAKRRIIDWAQCLISVHSILAERRPDITREPDYIFRLYSALRSLCQFCPEETQLISQLRTLIEPRFFLLSKLDAGYRRMSNGIRRRIVGHSWSRAYQAEAVTPAQEVLIRQMGFHLEP